MKNLSRICILIAVVMTWTADVYALTGSWRGTLNLGQMKVPLVFNFSEAATGETQCTMDSPSQGAKGIATEVVLCTADSVSLTCNAIGVSYTGKISAGSINGRFSQRGYVFPLDLTPDSPAEERRPQTPKPPIVLVSSRTPICRSSIRVRKTEAKSFTRSRKSILPSAVK